MSESPLEVNPKNPRISALLSLLQDDDLKVASLAMEQFLKLGDVADQTVAHHQESRDPHLRHRIHQLSSILARRRARREFIRAVEQEDMSLWDGVCQINALYDLQFSPSRAEGRCAELVGKLRAGTVGPPRIAALMREEEFSVPEEDTLDVDLYLIERVFEIKYGSPATLCALVHHLGQMAGWFSTIVLYNGRFCLIDRNQLLVDPTEDWHIAKLEAADKIHPCAKKHVWLGILTQMFLISLVEGHLRDLYHFGQLLTALNGTSLRLLPYPLGPAPAA